MHKHFEVKQYGSKDCAASCLLSIMRYYGFDASHDEVAYILKTDNNGTNAYNLINGAKSLGFDGYGIHYSYEEIINEKISFPIICHIVKNNMYHFIVLYEVNINKNIIYAMDPACGNIRIKFDEFKTEYQGTSIVLFPIKTIGTISNRKSIYEFIYFYAKNEYKSYIYVLVLSIIVIAFSLITNIYVKVLVDKVIPENSMNMLINVSIIFVCILIVKNIFNFVRGKFLIKVCNDLAMKINESILNHFFNLPYQFFKNKPTGEVMNRINDIKNFRGIFSEIIVNIIMDLLLIFISMIVLLIINLKLFLFTVIPLIIYFIIVLSYSKIFKKKIEKFKIKEGEYNKLLVESIEGYETNRNLNMINEINKKININHNSYIFSYSVYEKSLNNQLFLKNIVESIGYIITMAIGVTLIINKTITLGDYLIFNSILIYFTEPIKNILDLEPNINYIKNTYERISDLLLMKSNYTHEVSQTINGNITFSNLSYSYNNVNALFKDINFDIKKGSRFLIYGNSGNGKSTIIKIILKYLDGYSGTVKINGINIKDIEDSVIASSFAYVSQNNYLNFDTLKNNIVYDRVINENDYEKVINICNLYKLRDDNPLRNNFMIEENGFNVSGGERQKIILARALLKKSNYLILDEALSEVGEIEEKKIIKNIFDYYKDKTIIYITHKKEIIELFKEKYFLERNETC
jgi:ATP-binding cassette subfamily B protein